MSTLSYSEARARAASRLATPGYFRLGGTNGSQPRAVCTPRAPLESQSTPRVLCTPRVTLEYCARPEYPSRTVPAMREAVPSKQATTSRSGPSRVTITAPSPAALTCSSSAAWGRSTSRCPMCATVCAPRLVARPMMAAMAARHTRLLVRVVGPYAACDDTRAIFAGLGPGHRADEVALHRCTTAVTPFGHAVRLAHGHAPPPRATMHAAPAQWLATETSARLEERACACAKSRGAS